MPHSRTICILALASRLLLAASTKWSLYAGTGTGPDLTVKEWASAVVAKYPDEVDISVWLSSGSASQAALVGNVDCASKYPGHPTLCSSPPALNATHFGAGGVTFSSSWYSSYGDVQQLPSLAGPICVIYSKDVTGNLGSLEDRRLNLSMEVVGAVYGGRVTFWDDPQVQTLNPAVTLPHERIKVVARSDKSSLNEAFTKSIAYANPWWTQVPGYLDRAVGKRPRWPLGNYTDTADDDYMLQAGQEGIIVNALRRPFSMAYVDFTQVRRFGEFLGMAHIVSNFSGMPVPPTSETIRNAIDAYSAEFGRNDSTLALEALNPPRDAAYPITRFTYWYIRKSASVNGDCYRTWLLKELILYSYTDAAAVIADRNGWVIPPDSLVQVVRTRLEDMRCLDSESGQEVSVMSYVPPRHRRCPRGQFIAPNPGGSGVQAYLGCRSCSVGSYQPQDDEAGVFQCAAAPAGAFAAQPGQSAFNQCARGAFSRAPGQSSCELCPMGKFSPTSGFTQCVDCAVGRSTNGNQGSTQCELCPVASHAAAPGSHQCQGCPTGLTTEGMGSANSSFCSCAPGSYLSSPLTCHHCADIEGLVCPGHSAPLQAAPGYMMLEASIQPGPPPELYRCLPASHCPGGVAGRCAGGRKGLACARCPEGRIWDGHNCQECSRGLSVFLLTLWLLLVVMCSLCLLFMEVMLPGKMERDKYLVRLAGAGSLTALMSIMQVVGLISLLAVPWPARLGHFVGGSAIFLLDVKDLLHLSCAIYSTAGQYIVTAITLPIALTVMTAAQLARYCCGQGRFLDPGFLNGVGTVALVFFTPLMSSAVTPMICYTHPAASKSLGSFPSVLCGSAEHHAMLFFGIVLFLLGLTFLATVLMITWNAPVFSGRPGTCNSFLRATRFMLLPYRADRWYAAGILAPRGLLMAMVPVVLADDTRGQVILFSFIIVLYMAFVGTAWPWRLPLFNLLNLVVLGLLLLAMFLVAVAFVPAVAEQRSELFAAFLQVILVFAPMLAGVLLMLALIGFVGSYMAKAWGKRLLSMLYKGVAPCDKTNVALMLQALGQTPRPVLERAVDGLESCDLQMLLGALQGFEELGLLTRLQEVEGKKVGMQVWDSERSRQTQEARQPRRCWSEVSLQVRTSLSESSGFAGASTVGSLVGLDPVLPAEPRQGHPAAPEAKLDPARPAEPLREPSEVPGVLQDLV